MVELLRVPLSLCEDCVALAHDVSMGVLFSRGPALDQAAVKRLCLHISQEGRGVIDMSAQLAPNSVLLLGQRDTVERYQKKMRTLMPEAHLRKKNLSLPPMHTAIVRQRAIAERASVLLETASGGFQAPSVRLFSGVTGKASYNDHNSRDLLYRWVDHPQQLWSMVHETMVSGAEAVIHVGPAPNIIPATFKRLAEDIRGQTKGYTPSRLGLRAVSQLARRPWLSQLLPSATALLRAPFVQQINLEDWLLDQNI
jgi:[acyl-carrier-protein] S-malonyltransferase